MPSGKAVYNVESLYKEVGVTQRIARSPFFQPLGGLTGHPCVSTVKSTWFILFVSCLCLRGILVPFFEAEKTKLQTVDVLDPWRIYQVDSWTLATERRYHARLL